MAESASVTLHEEDILDVGSELEPDNFQYDRRELLSDIESTYPLQEKIGKTIKLLAEKLESAEEDIKFKIDMTIPMGGLLCAFSGFLRSYKMHRDIINQYTQRMEEFIRELEKNKSEFSEEEMGVLMTFLQEKLEQIRSQVTKAKREVDDFVAPLLSLEKEAESKIIELETWFNHLISGIQSTLNLYVDMNLQILRKMKVSDKTDS